MSVPESAESVNNLELKNRNSASILLFLTLLLPSFIPAEGFTLVMLFVCVIMLALHSFNIEWCMIRLVMPLVILALFGLSGLVFNPIMDFIKDLWYFAKVIPAICLGYMLSRSISDVLIISKIIVIAAVTASLIHLLQIAMNPDVMSLSFKLIREEITKGYYICAIGIATLFACHRLNVSLFRSPIFYIFLSIMSASVVLSFSRNESLILIIMLITIYGIWNISSLKTICLIAFLLVLVLVGVFAYCGNGILIDQPRSGPDTTFVGKAMGSLHEIIPSDYSDPKDIHTNWRGYEAYQALQSYSEGNALQYLFGQGFGALIDLKLYILLGGKEMRYVPITHNGFPYILVKTGLAGLVFYLLFFLRILLLSGKYSPVSNTNLIAKWMTIGLSLSLLVSTLSISGLFNKSSLTPLVILLGAFLYLCRNNYGSPNYWRKCEASTNKTQL